MNGILTFDPISDPVQELQETSDPNSITEFVNEFNDIPSTKKIIERLLILGFSVEEIKIGLRHPKFLPHCLKILNLLFGLPVSAQIASIRKVLKQISLLSDEEIEVLSQNKAFSQDKAASPKPKKKIRKTANVNTIRRISVLAALYGKENGLSIAQLLSLAELNLRALRASLSDFEKAGFISKKKVGRKYIYFLTHAGVTHFSSLIVQFFPCDLIKNAFNNSHKKNCTVRFSSLEILRLIRMAIEIDKELTKLGWYHKGIMEVFKLHKLSHIFCMIRGVKNNSIIQKPGAYLYAILVKGVPEEKRKEAIVKANLRNVPEDIVKLYRSEADCMTPKVARYFANALRKRYFKVREKFFPGVVEVIANFIRKRMKV